MKMNETPLTQEVIDGGGEDEKESLYARAIKHPLVTSGMILAGAGLAYAAVKTIQGATDKIAREVHIETSIAIDKSPAELYAFWREFKNLPLFMKNLESVEELDANRSHWVAKSISGARVEWDAEIYNEKENELIAWRSLESADVVNAGSVRFQKGPEGHGTYVRVTMNYNPPGGKLGAALAQLVGAEASQLINDDLRRLKQKLETGEIATIAGQTSGLAEREEIPAEAKAATMGDAEKISAEKELSNTRAA
ncbi:MAG: SRPBCC family protein [Acidobacteriota bacterium]